MKFNTKIISISLIIFTVILLPNISVAEKKKKVEKGYVVLRVFGEKGKIHLDPQYTDRGEIRKFFRSSKKVRVGSGRLEILKLVGNTSYELDDYYPKFYKGRFDFRRGRVQFMVEPGIVKYVGDIHLIISDDRNGVRLQVEIKDGETSALAELRKKRPKLLEKFEYKKDLIVFRRK